MNENNKIISKALHFIKDEFHNPEISIDSIAYHAGFSTDYFNHIFTAHTGFPIMTYVRYMRIKKAANLLRYTDQNIFDIALEVGYETHENFSRAFKKQYGMTPSEYREFKKNKVMYWAEMTDETLANRFIHEFPEFKLADSDDVIDFLFTKDLKRYLYLCSNIQYMGEKIVYDSGCFEGEFICIGDTRSNGRYLEAVTDDFDKLVYWLKKFSATQIQVFYSLLNIEQVAAELNKRGISTDQLTCRPQSIYTGEKIKCTLPENMQIRRLSADDIPNILEWAGDKRDGYIHHLLHANDYADESVLEYGIFRSGKMIAAVSCGIDSVHGIRMNDCAKVIFKDGEENDILYKAAFAHVTNEMIEEEILPFDDIQYGEYAETHRHFTSKDMGYEVVNYRYSFHR